MMRMRYGWGLATAVAMSTALAASADQSFGAGVTLATATSIETLYETPDAFVGKTVRVDGVVTAVCEEMGCWMALGSAKDAERVVRFKVEHEGEIVFPLAARGKRASAEGVFVRIDASDAHSMEAEHEHAQTQAAQTTQTAQTAHEHAQAREHADAHISPGTFGKTYQIKLTGAVVKGS